MHSKKGHVVHVPLSPRETCHCHRRLNQDRFYSLRRRPIPFYCSFPQLSFFISCLSVLSLHFFSLSLSRTPKDHQRSTRIRKSVDGSAVKPIERRTSRSTLYTSGARLTSSGGDLPPAIDLRSRKNDHGLINQIGTERGRRRRIHAFPTLYHAGSEDEENHRVSPIIKPISYKSNSLAPLSG